MIEHALQYAGRGWRVFPLQPGSKFPFKGSHGLKDASTDPFQVERWWSQHPLANIGLATGWHSPTADEIKRGVIPPNIIVIDCDGAEGIAEFQRDCALIGIAKTLIARTPRGGLHYYFVLPSGQQLKSVNAPRKRKGGPGIDIKANGGYVLLPPSVVGGRSYTGENSFPIADASTVLQ